MVSEAVGGMDMCCSLERHDGGLWTEQRRGRFNAMYSCRRGDAGVVIIFNGDPQGSERERYKVRVCGPEVSGAQH